MDGELDKSKAALFCAHPVLDHTPSIRAAAQHFRLSCPDLTWCGWNKPHGFRCNQGHAFQKSPHALVKARGREVCPSCIAQDCLERLKSLVAKAGIACLDDMWRGYKATYVFRCSEGHTWRRLPKHLSTNPGCPVCCQLSRQQKRRFEGLDRLRQAAKVRGGECLSHSYLGTAQRYRFRCAAGHEWLAAGADILSKGQWCGICANQAKRERYRLADGLQRLHALAGRRGGICQGTDYAGMAAKYLFRCAAGHEWQATGKRISRGAWCPQCELDSRRGRGRRPDGLQRLLEAARQKGGGCLSSDYVGTAGTYRFRCGEGHEWEAFGSAILRGTWCQQCAQEQRRLGLDKARQVAAEQGGECLSQCYLNRRSKLQWRCHRGHTWYTSMASILAGHWCPACAHQAQITSATSRAGKRYAAGGPSMVGHLPIACPDDDAVRQEQ